MLIIKIETQNRIGTILIGKRYLSVNVFTKYKKYMFYNFKKNVNF